MSLNNPAIVRKSLPEQAYEKLLELISGDGFPPGTRLEPMSALARRFKVSVPTIDRALTMLQAQGRVEKRHGSGTYVTSPQPPLTLKDSIVLCMEADLDVWGELTAMLLKRLHGSGRFVSLIDTYHSRAAELLQRISQSPAGCFVVHGHVHFPFAALQTPACRQAPLIGVVDWQPEIEGVPFSALVLTDHREGARLVTRHLVEQGHRRALFVGTSIQNYFLQRQDPGRHPHLGALIRQEWEKAGGTYQTLCSHSHPGGEIEFLPEDEFSEIFRQASPPTAIIGLRDTEAFLAQQLLQQHFPELVDQVAITGYYDTPWAAMGQPPISSVNLDIAEIAKRTCDAIRRIVAGEKPTGEIEWVAPRLVLRQSSAVRAGVPGALRTAAGRQPTTATMPRRPMPAQGIPEDAI